MAIPKDSSRLNWLMAAWVDKRHSLAKLFGRMVDLGAVQGMSPRILNKFLRMMDQVGAAQEEEVKIISEINAIEERHRQQRLHKKLRQAGPEPVRAFSVLSNDRDCEPPPRRTLWWLVVWWVMMRQQINQKKHDLTGD